MQLDRPCCCGNRDSDRLVIDGTIVWCIVCFNIYAMNMKEKLFNYNN